MTVLMGYPIVQSASPPGETIAFQVAAPATPRHTARELRLLRTPKQGRSPPFRRERV